METAISLRDVSVTLAGKKILNHVNLDVERNRFTALVGPNGAGKTTIFNLICGLIVQDEGSVQVDGLSYSKDAISIKKRLGVVFQQSALDGDLSIVQNLRFMAGLYNIRQDRVEVLAEQFGFANELNRKIRNLSGGQKRRVEIARALIHEPEILILDEPTVGLDPASKAMITDYIHELSENDVTVFWVTHLLDELNLDDSIVILDEGEVRSHGSLRELGGVEALLEAYHKPERLAL